MIHPADELSLYILESEGYTDEAWTRFFAFYQEIGDGGWFWQDPIDKEAWSAIDAALVVAEAGFEPA